MTCAIPASGTFAPIMAQAAECRSRWGPKTSSPARAQARRTIQPMPSRVRGRVGAVTVANTSRKETARRPSRSQDAIAAPASQIIFSFQDRHVVDLGGHVEDGVVDVTAVAA